MKAAAVCLKETPEGAMVLLVKAAGHGIWEFPGGELEEREMPFEGVTRLLLARTGYAGHVKRAPVAHRDEGGEMAFLLVRGAVKTGTGEPRRRPVWFGLPAAGQRLQECRTAAEALPMLTALETAVHWFYLQ